MEYNVNKQRISLKYKEAIFFILEDDLYSRFCTKEKVENVAYIKRNGGYQRSEKHGY
jgi:hypothetical protein